METLGSGPGTGAQAPRPGLCVFWHGGGSLGNPAWCTCAHSWLWLGSPLLFSEHVAASPSREGLAQLSGMVLGDICSPD